MLLVGDGIDRRFKKQFRTDITVKEKEEPQDDSVQGPVNTAGQREREAHQQVLQIALTSRSMAPAQGEPKGLREALAAYQKSSSGGGKKKKASGKKKGGKKNSK